MKGVILLTFFTLVLNGCVALRNVSLEIHEMLTSDDARLKEILFEMMKSFMDQSADPCVDFHQYACGNFDTYNYFDEKTRVKNMVDLVMTYIDIALNNTINALPKLFKEQPNIKTSDPRRKLWAYYESCMDSEYNAKVGVQSLFKLIQKLGPGLAFDEKWQGSNSTLGVIMGKLKAISYEAFIEADVYADFDDPTKNILYLVEPQDSFVRGYFNGSAKIKDQITYKIMGKVGKVIRQFNVGHSKIGKLKTEMVKFERQYRKIAKRSEKRAPIYEEYQKLTIAELQKRIPDFDWIGYFKEFRGTNLNLEEKVSVVDIKYFENLAQLLKQNTNIAISRIMIDFAETYLNLMGVFEKQIVWKKCVEQASELMTEIFSHLFAQQVGFEHHPELVNMTEDLRENFGQLIQKAKWIEPKNKPALLDKLQGLDLKSMGLPKNFLNPRYRRLKLQGIKIKRNFFLNTIKLKSNAVKQEMEWIGKPLDDADMGDTPENLFAEHDYVKNKISVGMGFLSPPFFHASFPAFYHFATLGYTLGHEMAHAFDSVGMHFFGEKPDPQNLLYTDKTAKRFNKIVKCFRREYNLAGVSSGSTQETIPDSIGLKVAYETYLEWKKNNSKSIKNEIIPGLNLNDDKLFFLSFAMSFCSQPVINGTNNDPNLPHPYGTFANYHHIPSDPHPPQAIRLLGTLRLSKEFSQIFNCPVNSKMNPETKCTFFD